MCEAFQGNRTGGGGGNGTGTGTSGVQNQLGYSSLQMRLLNKWLDYRCSSTSRADKAAASTVGSPKA